MLAAIQRLPRAERQGLSTVVPTVDALLARLAEEARHLHAVERQFEPGPEEITRRLAETRSEAASPGREQRLGVLARRLITLKDLAERRDRLAVEVTKALAAVTRIRAELDRVVSTGLNQGQDLRSALKDAETLLQGPATTV
jgi:hypothetical protein